MDYIISGGLGFIGRNLKIDKTKNFMVLDWEDGPDLCNPVIKIPSCKTFIHLAALTNVRESVSYPQTFIAQNSMSTLNCLEHARKCKSKFIFISSMGAPAALSPYSASKLACEAYCNSYKESFGLEVVILRLSNVYGPYSEHKDSIVAKFIKRCLDREVLTIYGNGYQTRDFVYVSDVADTILDYNGSEILNVAFGTSYPIRSIAEHIQELSFVLTGYAPDIVYLNAVKGEILKVEQMTDIVPKVPLEQGLETTFKWFMENYNASK